MRWSYFGVYLFIGCTENTKAEQMFGKKIANYILCVLWNAVRKGVWVVWKVAENSFRSKHIQRFFTLFVSKRKVDDPIFYIIGSVINDTVLCQIAAFFNFLFSVLACSLYTNQDKKLFYEKFGFQKLPNVKYGYGMVIEM